MIKNIVFDMGNVLVNYDDRIVCRRFIKDEKELELVRTAVFVSPEWIMLDMGVISDEEALKSMQSRLPDNHAREMAALCMNHWHEYCMDGIEEMGSVIKELKDQGYGIYLCSNASMRLLQCYKQVIPGIEYFDGVLFSAEVKCIKPQKEIYLHLFESFQLKPEECFFIDDLQRNIDGAKACGMEGYCHKDGNVESLKKVLRGLKNK